MHIRTQSDTLLGRLREPRRFIQVVAGPRQVGKSTLVQQAVERLSMSVQWASADEPELRDRIWLTQQWDIARTSITSDEGAVLVIDEVQKVPRWSETVKLLWDEDTRRRTPLRVVLLGSAPLLIERGLTESLAGRFEKIVAPHWSYAEMSSAFGWSWQDYVTYGGYPGSASLINDPQRWQRYILDSLVETSISRDVLLLTRVDKPALLRRVFDLACRYSGRMLSYTKMLGQLQDAGNTVTVAHYLDLLNGAGMVRGLPKYAGDIARSRASSPKLQVFNTALMTALIGTTREASMSDHEYWGHLVESAVGAHLINAELQGLCTVFYWREGNNEVDFVVRCGDLMTAIEVKSGRSTRQLSGMDAFVQAHHPQRTLLVGGDGIPIDQFLAHPVEYWVGQR